MRTPVSLLLSVLALLAGCGGDSIDAAVTAHEGRPAACAEAGAMVFLGERETVYECTFDYDAGHEEEPPALCFVRADGDLYDVTFEPGVTDEFFCG